MRDKDRTKGQLIDELVQLRQRISELEKSETEHKQIEEALRRTYDELEVRVQERTAELARANEDLQTEIIERKRVEKQIRQFAIRNKMLAELSQTFSEAGLDYKNLLYTITRRISKVVGDGCCIYLLSDDSHLLNPVALYHPNQKEIDLIREFLATSSYGVDQGLMGRVVQTDQPILIPVVSQEQIRTYINSKNTPYQDHFDLHSMLYVPLRVQSRTIGVMGVWRDKTEISYTLYDQVFLQGIADRAALAIENARLFERAQQELTERKHAENKIQEQADLLDKAHDAIIVRDLEHKIIYWNKGAQYMYGWIAQEATGKNANELLYNAESPEHIEAQRSVMKYGEWKGELDQVTKANKRIIVESRWTLVRSHQGRPKSILIINTDITEKKWLEEQLIQAQRMESVGTLASGIAHDLNNMLTPIMISLQMLHKKFTDEESQRLLNILEKSTQRGANLIKQILSFSRRIKGEHKTTQIAHIISEIEKMTADTFPKYIEVKTNIPDDLFTISGDAVQLHQVLMNLCVNARDAMPDGGILSICAENILVTEDYVRMHIDAKIGPHIIISVSDTGCGIPPEAIGRIFEPFFTTKAPGEGTGLGLSTAIAIVKSHQGFIDVHSEVGKGTVFRIYLPATAVADTPEIEEQKFEQHTGQGEVILLVDDEDSIREITSNMLKANGYKVVTASDGAEAVVLYSRNRDDIKVVLMDMMMPVMDGLASIQMLRKINPQVKVIAISGLTESHKLTEIAEAHVNTFLMKPYTAQRLLETIHEVLSTK